MPDTDTTEFLKPPRTKGHNGEPRTVGMELEFAGLDLEEVACIVANEFDGQAVMKNRFVYEVTGTVHGSFTVELDSAFLKEGRYKEFLNVIGADDLAGRQVDDVLLRLASVAVPLEVVTPPVSLEDLPAMERLRRSLKRRKALGTGTSLIYAFGLHINAEAPSFDPVELLNVLRAFLLLYEWLKRESDVDPSRKLTPYIDPFPETYVKKVLDPGYSPSIGQLMDDYLDENPTRNRALDMLPLFAHIDENRVKAKAKQPQLVSARPAFHYRLPNCRVDEKDWTIAAEWNRWVEVERLAYSGNRLVEKSEEYLAHEHSLVDWLRNLFT